MTKKDLDFQIVYFILLTDYTYKVFQKFQRFICRTIYYDMIKNIFYILINGYIVCYDFIKNYILLSSFQNIKYFSSKRED